VDAKRVLNKQGLLPNIQIACFGRGLVCNFTPLLGCLDLIASIHNQTISRQRGSALIHATRRQGQPYNVRPESSTRMELFTLTKHISSPVGDVACVVVGDHFTPLFIVMSETLIFPRERHHEVVKE
jgi:hypothetical protein